MLTLVTDSTSEPITTAELKTHLRIGNRNSTEDTLLGDYITAARRFCEEETGASFCTVDQTWDETYPQFPNYGESIFLSRYPVQSITSVTYIDTDNTSQTLDSTAYILKAPDRIPAEIFEAPDNNWPSTHASRKDAVTVRYVVNQPNTDQRMRLAVRLLAGHYYANREALLTGTISKEIELGLERILSQVRANVYS